MVIVGFSLSKYDCERNETSFNGSVEINLNISIKGVKKTFINLASKKDEVLKIDFIFASNYSNDIGKILIKGEIIYSDTKNIIDETFKTWNLDKKLTAIVNEEVLNFIYNKVSIKAIEIADSLNLPLPVQIPKLNF